jgi:formylglycine-generating enzyme required for sulfatase activity
MRVVARVAGPLFVLVALSAFGGARAERAEDLSLADADAGADEDDDVESADDDSESDEEASSSSNAKTSRSGCPKEMVRVGDACMDRYEAPNKKGARPLVMQTAQEAEEWCASKSKRLCSEDEWINACEGAQKRQYPYGGEHEDGRCNDDKEWRTVNETVLAKWPADEAKEHNKSLYQAAKSGTKRGCRSSSGAYDLTGNVEEWVLRSRSHANDYKHILIGCYWSGCYGGGKPTCHSTNSAHGPGFRFYETGFRCCRDAPKKR